MRSLAALARAYVIRGRAAEEGRKRSGTFCKDPSHQGGFRYRRGRGRRLMEGEEGEREREKEIDRTGSPRRLEIGLEPRGTFSAQAGGELPLPEIRMKDDG